MHLYEISFPVLFPEETEKVQRRSYVFQHTTCPSKEQVRKAINKLYSVTDPDYKDADIYRFIMDTVLPLIKEWPVIESGIVDLDCRATLIDLPGVGKQSVVISEVFPIEIE